MKFLILMLLLCRVEQLGGVTHDHVDVVEVNHFYDNAGKIVFDQLIYYNYSKRLGYVVVAWKILEGAREKVTPEEHKKRTIKAPVINGVKQTYNPRWIGHSAIPTRQHSRGLYLATWHDGHVLRRITCCSTRETWTQIDPEATNKKVLPQEQRKGLREW